MSHIVTPRVRGTGDRLGCHLGARDKDNGCLVSGMCALQPSDRGSSELTLVAIRAIEPSGAGAGVTRGRSEECSGD